MIPLISQLPEQYSTIILLGLIILAFVVAYKVMNMIFQTLFVTVMSAGFYLTLVYLFNYNFTLNNMLFYAFLGSTLYAGFKLLASAYQIAETLISVPYKLFMILIFKPGKIIINKLGSSLSTDKVKNLKNKKEKQSNKSSENNTKEVVLDKVMHNEENEDEE